jgi:hypothetical protein
MLVMGVEHKAIRKIHSLGRMEGGSNQAIERRADPGEEVCLPRLEFYASGDTDGFLSGVD